MFCTGTMGEIAFVAQLDDTIFNRGAAGDTTEKLAALYEDLIQQEAGPAIV
jgi:branched-subunit amino acid aminotransferase/4-amino-4-deoxychorismate lyase